MPRKRYPSKARKNELPRRGPWLITSEAAAYARLTPDTVRLRHNNGYWRRHNVRCGRNGRDLLLHAGDLDRYLQGGVEVLNGT